MEKRTFLNLLINLSKHKSHHGVTLHNNPTQDTEGVIPLIINQYYTWKEGGGWKTMKYNDNNNIRMKCLQNHQIILK